MRVVVALLAVCLSLSGLSAASGPPVDIPTRARGAQRVVVGTVIDVQASFERNQFGDQLIVSRAQVRVEEALKGSETPTITVDVEGGTVGDLTLHVSDMPRLEPGERAVFFLNRGAAESHLPHLRGLGILKLDERNHVRGSSLTLEAVRTLVDKGR